MNRDTTRLLLIGSSVVAAALSIWVGIPRLQSWSTPRLERVWVVSSSLGDEVASAAPKEVLAGTPVTLYAVVETTLRGRTRFFGPIQRARLGDEVVDVEPWSGWWNSLEIFWFKVEPLFGFANETFDVGFSPRQIGYGETHMWAWGYRDQHAADTRPTGDDFPRVDVGTMRFKAQAVVSDVRDRVLDEAMSPGPEGVHTTSIEEQPHRVSVRADDQLLGVLQGYAGLPYVPVLAFVAPQDHPAANFIGGSILDYWIAAQRQRGRDLPFFGWEELGERGDVIVEEMFLANDGNYYYTDDPLRAVTFDEVRVGDLLSIEDHVGVLFQDRGPGGAGDGVLNTWDRLLGGYFEPLRDMPAGDAFHSGITVYRWPTGSGAVGAAEPTGR